jgi:UDP-N-acetylglucosamine 1-carboxyvinyltransferase
VIRLDSFVVKGGRRLSGTVRISGSKNAALPCLFATLLSDEESVVDNVPDLEDIRTTLKLLARLGKEVEFSRSRVKVRRRGKLLSHAPYDLVRRMRASVVVMGPLLARLGRARVSLPGGCSIGARPVNYHLDAFRRMGARVEVEGGYMSALAPRLAGARIRLPFPSVGATENVLMAAVLARGKTVLLNAAREPEIGDLVDCLLSMGADIRGRGTSVLTVRGGDRLRGARHRVIPDRIEAGTYLIAGAITGGRVRLTHAEPAHLGNLLGCLKRAGARLAVHGREISLDGAGRRWPVSVRTAVYPGFPTDMQAQWMALMALTRGHCRVTETVFENRFLHAQELWRMGARIATHGPVARVTGVARLTGCPLMVSDLRAGAALVLAALAARGRSRILRVYHLDRGYEKMEIKLRALGARIRRAPQ